VKALVTGGNGFLGRHVVTALRGAGFGVRVLDLAKREETAGVEQVTADLLTCETLEAAFADVDVLVHLAASLRGSDDEVLHNTVEGSRRLFEAMARMRTAHLVLASSLSVYDWSKVGDTLDESAAILDADTSNAYDGYARAKTLQEQLAREFAERRGWALTVLRPAVLWGRGAWGEFLVGARLGPLRAVVAPRAAIRLLYVENAADAFALAAGRRDGGERTFNLIDPPALSTWQYAGLVGRRLGGIRVPLPYGLGLGIARIAALLSGGRGSLPYFLQPRRFEALHKPVRCNAERAQRGLGWAPRFRFEEALARAESGHA
jgi:UDP-glucose 4-epimerase